MQSVTRTDLPSLTIRRGFPVVATLRVAGRVLLMAGLIIAGFVVHQLVITTWAAQQAQGDLVAQFDTRVASGPVDTVPYTPFDRPVSPVASTSPPVALLPGEDVPGELGVPATIVTEPVPGVGEPVGRIVIPSAGVDWTFVEGVTRAALRSGAGHMPGTALPGQPGNAVISGHRTTYGAPFADLDAVVAGDRITVETATGTHLYEAVDVIVVAPDDVWVTEQWAGGWLTLTTCNPRFSARERLVVIARMVDGPNAGVILGDR